MKTSLITCTPINFAPGDHLLTYAEIGFSPLSLNGGNCNVNVATLQAFADKVNQRSESGSLLPQAPISAVPARLIRKASPENEQKLVKEIQDFLQAIKSHGTIIEHLYIDFGTPDIPPHAERAVHTALGN